MKKILFAGLVLFPAVVACSAGQDRPAPGPLLEPPLPAPQAAEPVSNPLDDGKEGATSELVDALRKGAQPIFVMIFRVFASHGVVEDEHQPFVKVGLCFQSFRDQLRLKGDRWKNIRIWMESDRRAAAARGADLSELRDGDATRKRLFPLYAASPDPRRQLVRQCGDNRSANAM